MAVSLYWGIDRVLRSSNGCFSGLYDALIEIVETSDIGLNLNLKRLIDDLWNGCNGIGLDIDEYIYSKEDLEWFIDVVKQAIDSLLEQNDFELYKFFFETFYQNLLKISQSFQLTQYF